MVMTLNRGESYEIHEVYYDDAGKPKTYTMNSVKPFGEDLRELRQDIMWMLNALDTPILTPEDFPDLEEVQDAI